MTSNDYLDSIQSKFYISSDYGLSKILGCTRQSVSRYRKGQDKLGDEVAVKVAELLEIDPGQVLADVAAERTKCPAAKHAWERVARTMAGMAASLFLSVFLLFSPAPADADEAANSLENNIHYAKSGKLLTN